MNIRNIFLWGILGVCGFGSASALAALPEKLEQVPVQHSGRIKPFETFAGEALLSVTGKSRWDGQNASEIVWQWIASPEKWASRPLLVVPSKDLRREFSLMVIGGRMSPEVALQNKAFLDKAQAAAMRRSRKEKLGVEERAVLEVYDKAAAFRRIAEGAEPGWIAHPQEPRAGWLSMQEFMAPEAAGALAQFYDSGSVARVRESSAEVLTALRENPETLESRAADFVRALEQLFESGGVILDQDLLRAERIYNRLSPFGWAWKSYLAAMLFCFGISIFFKSQSGILKKIVLGAAMFFYAAGFLVHSYGFYLRCLISGRPPVTNMYESIIWVSWAVVFFAAILWAFYRAAMIPATASLVAVFALGIAHGFPVVLDPALSPLVPVLRSNLWLTVHVLTITLSYGAFALAWGLGHVVIFRFAGAPEKIERNKMLAGFLYRALQIGVILLASGTVLGGVWANYSWGRFWGWDPKETWALIALLGYLAVLHGRFAGWLGLFGFAAASVAAFLGVVMAWNGVNFVLAAGLHSYGFGGGGALYVLGAALFDLALVAGTAVYYKKRTSGIEAASV